MTDTTPEARPMRAPIINTEGRIVITPASRPYAPRPHQACAEQPDARVYVGRDQVLTFADGGSMPAPLGPHDIWTGSGYLDPRNPTAARFTLADIARGLSRRARYAGHTDGPHALSVAEHSVAVAVLAEKLGLHRDLMAVALMHDAAEAFLVDMPAPVKSLPELAPYRRIEDALQSAICAAFGLTAARRQWGDLVACLDRAAMFAEKADLLSRAGPWPGVPDLSEDETPAAPMSPARAEAAFLVAARRLDIPQEGRTDV